GAHGNGFDRVSAFQDGYEGGAAECAAYQNHPPAVTEAAYTSYQDQASGGNLGLGDMLSTVTKSLQTYWARQASGTKTTSAPTVVAASNAPACRGGTDGGVLDDTVTYCPSTNTITYDAKTLQHAHDGIGDFASGALVAAAWSSSVQHQTGHTLGTAAARKGAECLAGAWAANSSTSLSPGDLDEAVTLLVAGNHESTNRGSAFERVAAFRAGYKNGPSRCLE
ncbi:MAG: hypothetical protein QOF40_774, partial [Actinomycetota bacterium]|nr:hypothetical protein [Actinomycetota bacterium]